MIREFFTLPALIMFALGVFLAGWVMQLVGGARRKVTG